MRNLIRYQRWSDIENEGFWLNFIISILAKTRFYPTKCTDRPGRRLRSLTKVWSSKESLSVCISVVGASQVVLAVRNPPANAEDMRDLGLIPRSGVSPWEGHGNPLQYSCLENPMDRGAWQATVHGVSKSRKRLKQLNRQGGITVTKALKSLG